MVIQNLHIPVKVQSSLNRERWFYGILANGEYEDVYVTCVKDSLTVFGIFATRIENLCDATCHVCKEFVDHISRKSAIHGVSIDPNKPKSRREIVEEKRRMKRNLKTWTEHELEVVAKTGAKIPKFKTFKKRSNRKQQKL